MRPKVYTGSHGILDGSEGLNGSILQVAELGKSIFLGLSLCRLYGLEAKNRRI